MVTKTQEDFFKHAQTRIFAGNEVMLNLLFGNNPITDDELRALIEKRPHVYKRFSKYIGTRS